MGMSAVEVAQIQGAERRAREAAQDATDLETAAQVQVAEEALSIRRHAAYEAALVTHLGAQLVATRGPVMAEFVAARTAFEALNADLEADVHDLLDAWLRLRVASASVLVQISEPGATLAALQTGQRFSPSDEMASAVFADTVGLENRIAAIVRPTFELARNALAVAANQAGTAGSLRVK